MGFLDNPESSGTDILHRELSFHMQLEKLYSSNLSKLFSTITIWLHWLLAQALPFVFMVTTAPEKLPSRFWMGVWQQPLPEHDDKDEKSGTLLLLLLSQSEAHPIMMSPLLESHRYANISHPIATNLFMVYEKLKYGSKNPEEMSPTRFFPEVLLWGMGIAMPVTVMVCDEILRMVVSIIYGSLATSTWVELSHSTRNASSR
nr:hypothetical protein Iba_chr15dCG3880 [Ipomoea batatas]